MEHCAPINTVCDDPKQPIGSGPVGGARECRLRRGLRLWRRSCSNTSQISRDTVQGDDMAKKASARKPNAAFMKPMTISPKLAVVLGSKPLPRTEVTKKLWAYIKKNGLQDKKNKRMIKADEALKAVFGGKATVNMFEMTKLVSKHLK